MPEQINSSNDSASVINFPRDTTLKETNRILRYLAPLAVQLDGTASGYKATMRRWFIDNGALEADADQLTALCDKWYTMTREPWHGWVTFSKATAVSNGTKGGDNASLTCAPSTDTVAGKDDYAGLPLFACVDCNFIVDPETKEPQITAIAGITDNFRRHSPDHFVGVLQMSGYFYTTENDTSYTEGYSSLVNLPYANIAPLDEAIRPNGNVRPWVVHSKYFNHTVNGKLTSYAGVIPTARNISHNTLHTLAAATGVGYSGGTTADDAFLKIMLHIKYASLSSDNIVVGCCANNSQCTAKVSETAVKRVVLSEADGASFEVGMGVYIGTNESNDRWQANTYSISGDAGAVITAVTPVTISGTNYTAVYVDTDSAFDTVADTTLITTYHWTNGSTDCVLGNDGSPKSNTSGKYPGKIQGIEFMQGGYEVFADVILKLYKESDGTYWYEPYVCRDTAKFATSITADYKASGVKLLQPAAANWYYIKRLGYKKGVFFPIDITGASSSTYVRDACYALAATEGIREWLARGTLNSGVADAGLSCIHGYAGVSAAFWTFVGRLSPNGNRGEWAA